MINSINVRLPIAFFSNYWSTQLIKNQYPNTHITPFTGSPPFFFHIFTYLQTLIFFCVWTTRTESTFFFPTLMNEKGFFHPSPSLYPFYWGIFQSPLRDLKGERVVMFGGISPLLLLRSYLLFCWKYFNQVTKMFCGFIYKICKFIKTITKKEYSLKIERRILATMMIPETNV